MAGDQLEQQRRVARIGMPLILAFWFLTYGRVLFEPMAANPDDPRIRESAWAVILLWPITTMCLVLHRMNPAKFAIARTGVRILYSLGLATMLLHLAVAFHLGHAWSHADAFDRTERIGGYGEGIFVSYGFAMLWIVEAVWMWIAFDCYLNRRAWWNRLIIGFMWFVLFNAAVVYGHGIARWGGLLFLTAPWLVVLIEARARPSSMEHRPPGDRVPPPAGEPGRTP